MNRENFFDKIKEQDNHPVAFNIRPLDTAEPVKIKPVPENKDGK
jgi:hypothetical protein